MSPRLTRERLMTFFWIILLLLFLVLAHPAHAQTVSLSVVRDGDVSNVPVLTWTTSGVTDCVATGGWSGSKPASGTERLPAITATTEYVLTCRGPHGSVFAEWTAPTLRTDGSPLTNLAGYRLLHGATSGAYASSVEVRAPATSHTLTGLPPGQRFFVIVAFDAAGAVSEQSNEVSAVVSAARIIARASLAFIAPPRPQPPVNLRVTPVVAGLGANPVFSVAPDGTRGVTVLGFAAVGTPCTGPRLFRYRGKDYHALSAERVQWWASRPTARNATACAPALSIGPGDSTWPPPPSMSG